jgi:hypothetical protein
MFQGHKSQGAMMLPKIPLNLRNKSSNSPIYNIMRFCGNASVPRNKNSNHIKTRCTDVIRNNVPKSNKHCNYEPYFNITMIKHVEYTTVKQQENMLPPEENIQRWKQQKQELIAVLYIYCNLYEFRQNEVLVLCNIIIQ